MRHEPPDRYKLYHFRIDLLLGRGGTGVVYRAVDTQSGEIVAVKLFHANFFRNNTHVRELAKSVKRFKRFNHHNVVKIFDFVSGDEGHCLVEEYVDGPDLRWYIENRPWNLPERMVVVAQVCNGLQYIHDQGFVHHDLKPANILFTRKGIAKLTDYSLAREKLFNLLDTGLKEQVTPMFVPPEIIRGERATPRSDIYSLGATFYLMFAGRVPFQVDSLQRLYECHLKVMPDHPSYVNPRCPRELGDIIMRMMDKEPDARFENCDELRIRMSDIGRSRI
ncbi:MAG TPA: serine/threonine-protein kinase [Candidatus Hydrogenedentes bacterium]|nr:serine/threonine-protein kinase [Candidatus Hydrogenedentota bacterium]